MRKFVVVKKDGLKVVSTREIRPTVVEYPADIYYIIPWDVRFCGGFPRVWESAGDKRARLGLRQGDLGFDLVEDDPPLSLPLAVKIRESAMAMEADYLHQKAQGLIDDGTPAETALVEWRAKRQEIRDAWPDGWPG